MRTIMSKSTNRSPSIAILDTCLIRGAIHLDKQAVDDLRQLRTLTEKISLRISDIGLTEIGLALLEERIPWDRWREGLSIVLPVLDHQAPIVSWNDYTGGPKILTAGNIALWRHLSQCKSYCEVERAFRITVEGEQSIEVDTSRKVARQVYDQNVAQWIAILDRAKVTADKWLVLKGKRLSESRLVDHLLTTLAKDTSVALRDGLDAHTRVWARYSLMYAEGKYNPRTDKGRRDANDFYQLKFLSIPAFLCTRDRRLRQVVQNTKSPQAKLVVDPGTLLTLHAPTD